VALCSPEGFHFGRIEVHRLRLDRRLSELTLRATLAVVLCALIGAAQGTAGNSALAAKNEAALREATNWTRTIPEVAGKYEYIMTARVRLLFFWVRRDDVGGGTIRRGAVPEDPQRELISLLIGSDPAKAPRRINRWGAAQEVVRHAPDAANTVDASAFFGFMTRAAGEASASELQKQMADEKAGKKFQYQAVISRLDRELGIAKTVPFATEKELDIHQIAPMRDQVFAELDGSGGKFRETSAQLRQSCPRSAGFLASVAELVDGAVERGAHQGKLCYLHYGELYTLTLKSANRVAEKRITVEMKTEPKMFDRSYRELLDAEFEILNHQTGKKSEFTLLLGTTGAQRGVPVQITYQPNWWFQVILHLK
jgi:hypothetical protein